MPPATPSGASLLRASVTATHSDVLINQAITAFAEVGRELGLIRGFAGASADQPFAIQAGE